MQDQIGSDFPGSSDKWGRGLGEPARELPCPLCQKPMRVESRRGVSVDVCDEHGMWLDRGELDQILMRLESRLTARRSSDVSSARRSGKMSGALFGWWSLLFD